MIDLAPGWTLCLGDKIFTLSSWGRFEEKLVQARDLVVPERQPANIGPCPSDAQQERFMVLRMR
jgi:hypothetical protein